MIRHKQVDIPIYDRAVYFYAGNGEETNKHFREEYNGDKDLIVENYLGLTVYLKNGGILVWCRRRTDIPSLVHELHHAVGQVMNFMGMSYSEDSTEAYAYLAGWLAKEWINDDGWKVISSVEMKDYKKKEDNND